MTDNQDDQEERRMRAALRRARAQADLRECIDEWRRENGVLLRDFDLAKLLAAIVVELISEEDAAWQLTRTWMRSK